MGAKRAVVVGIALAALAAGPARAADELSVDQRLEDRREVAAGTRAQVLGFQDGRFYANGWHITGEMGGIITPPLKLLDSVSFGVDGAVGRAGDAVHEPAGATSATSCRRTAGLQLQPHRRRARRRARRAARAHAAQPRQRTSAP